MNVASAAALAVFSFVSCITPGPNNLMLAAAGSRVGFNGTWPHLLGIVAGWGAMFLLAGLGLDVIFREQAAVRVGLSILGALYLLYLSTKLWRTSKIGTPPSERPLGFFGAAAFQFVNPKAWLATVPAVAAFTDPSENPIMETALAFLILAVVGLPCMAFWAALGAGARRLLERPGRLVLFNRVMAVLTALTAILFLV